MRNEDRQAATHGRDGWNGWRADFLGACRWLGSKGLFELRWQGCNYLAQFSCGYIRRHFRLLDRAWKGRRKQPPLYCLDGCRLWSFSRTSSPPYLPPPSPEKSVGVLHSSIPRMRDAAEDVLLESFHPWYLGCPLWCWCRARVHFADREI